MQTTVYNQLGHVHTTYGSTPIKNNIENGSIVLNHNSNLEQFLIISPQVTQM